MSKLTLYFKRPKDWGSSIRLHYWGTQPEAAATKWPGVPMRAIGDEWYFYEIKGVAAASIVFNDGEGQQTSDLSRDQEGWYTLSDGWHAKDPDVAVPQPSAATVRSRVGYVSSAR
jgi:hypothetical protein